MLFKVNFQIISLTFSLHIQSLSFPLYKCLLFMFLQEIYWFFSTEKHIWYQKNLNIGTHEWNCFSLLLNFLKGISFLYVVIKRRVKYFFPAVSKLFHQVDHKWLKPITTYTANIYRMVIGNFICNPLSAYRILPIGTNTYR